MKMLIAVTAILAVCGVAQAAAGDDPPSLHVRFDDLNLGSSRGVEVLLARLEYAAEEVCRSFNSRQLVYSKKYSDCKGTAIGAAVRSINHPRLLAMYLQKLGHQHS